MIKYAPVLITTLNRFNHLKKCMESLERCTGAEYTDVFIGLDYPPSSCYEEGWTKIDKYLAQKEQFHKFRTFNVRRRDHNCGICKKDSNLDLLRSEVTAIYDRYISLEDDNEVSPNFLEYINKCLTVYEKDPRIIMITGYSFPDIRSCSEITKNVVALNKVTVWGGARWKCKDIPIEIYGKNNYRDQIIGSTRKFLRLCLKNPVCAHFIMTMKLGGHLYGDFMLCAYAIIEDKYCVYPKFSKLRNLGYDGTGAHCGEIDKGYSSQYIDENTMFEPETIQFSKYQPEDSIKGIVFNRGMKKYLLFLLTLLRYVFYRLTKRDLFFFLYRSRGKNIARMKQNQY